MSRRPGSSFKEIWTPDVPVDIEMLGYMATCIGGIAQLPQAFKVATSDNIGGISPITYILSMICNVLWFIYAKKKGVVPLMISSSTGFIVAFSILSIVIYKTNRKKEDDKRE